MKRASRFYLSGQVVVAVAVILGVSMTAQANKSKVKNSFKPSYKVESCDCLGFSEDIPTFLSDLASDYDSQIYGEGRSIAEAEKQAGLMCTETYNLYAKSSKQEHPESVTQTGCQKLKSTPDGDWVSVN